jgi:hypothetical protein
MRVSISVFRCLVVSRCLSLCLSLCRCLSRSILFSLSLPLSVTPSLCHSMSPPLYVSLSRLCPCPCRCLSLSLVWCCLFGDAMYVVAPAPRPQTHLASASACPRSVVCVFSRLCLCMFCDQFSDGRCAFVCMSSRRGADPSSAPGHARASQPRDDTV